MNNTPPQIEIKPVCPACGGPYWRYGAVGSVIYRECKRCGHRGKTQRVLQK